MAHHGNSCDTPSVGLLARLPQMPKLCDFARQLRPWRLDAVATNLLRDYALLGVSLQLLKTHFPAQLAEVKECLEYPDVFWIDVLIAFLRQVDAQWFPIDWACVDFAYNVYHDSDNDQMELMDLTHGIPLKTFNLIEMDGFAEYEYWEQSATLALLSFLMKGTDLPIETMSYFEELSGITNHIHSDEDDDEEGEEPEEGGFLTSEINNFACERAILAHDFSRYDEPFCWLGDLAKLVAGSAEFKGNPFLDRDTRDYQETTVHLYKWSQDIPLVKEFWAQAQPMAEKLERFDDLMKDSGIVMQAIELLWNIYTNIPETSPLLVDVLSEDNYANPIMA